MEHESPANLFLYCGDIRCIERSMRMVALGQRVWAVWRVLWERVVRAKRWISKIRIIWNNRNKRKCTREIVCLLDDYVSLVKETEFSCWTSHIFVCIHPFSKLDVVFHARKMWVVTWCKTRFFLVYFTNDICFLERLKKSMKKVNNFGWVFLDARLKSRIAFVLEYI